MPELEFDVPPSFWDTKNRATLHFRRLRPGDFERIPPELAEAFLSGSQPLRLQPGSHEFLEVQLEHQEEGIKPRMRLQRIPVDATGRIDCAQLETDRSLPQDERRAKHGWWLTDDENDQVFSAMEKLIESHQTDVLSAILDLIVPTERPHAVSAGAACRAAAKKK